MLVSYTHMLYRAVVLCKCVLVSIDIEHYCYCTKILTCQPTPKLNTAPSHALYRKTVLAIRGGGCILALGGYTYSLPLN